MTRSRQRFRWCKRWSIRNIGTICLQCFCFMLFLEIVLFSDQYSEYAKKADKITFSEIFPNGDLNTTASLFYKEKLRKSVIEQKDKLVFRGMSYKREFSYPLEVDMGQLIRDIRMKKNINISAINPQPFHFTILPQSKCSFQKQENWTILILVKSDICNKERRETIRNTWGNLQNISNVNIVFMLGLPKNETECDMLEELNLFHDIIQENFIDTYRNNTIKTVMGFNWAVKYCRHVDYLFFVDDDYFVNVKNLCKLPDRLRTKVDVYGGTITSRAIPFRDKGSKWYISWENYPFDRWPPYIMGGAYIVSMTTAKQFQLAFPYIKQIFMDDAYLGIVARKLHISPLGLPGFYSGKKKRKSMLGGMVASHGYDDPSDVIFTWKRLNDKHNLKQKVQK